MFQARCLREQKLKAFEVERCFGMTGFDGGSQSLAFGKYILGGGNRLAIGCSPLGGYKFEDESSDKSEEKGPKNRGSAKLSKVSIPSSHVMISKLYFSGKLPNSLVS